MCTMEVTINFLIIHRVGNGYKENESKYAGVQKQVSHKDSDRLLSTACGQSFSCLIEIKSVKITCNPNSISYQISAIGILLI